MGRQLYFLIPDRQHALDVVQELNEHGISSRHMHALGDQRTRLDGLPNASRRQDNDKKQRARKIYWNINLACFALALTAMIILAILLGRSWWLLLPATIIGINFLIGLMFSSAANSRLGEFRDALAHGEILLIVDVPESRVTEVETDIHQHHPEASIGSVGWKIPAIGL